MFQSFLKDYFFLLFITLFLSAFEGIVNSAVIGYLPNFSKNSSLEKFVSFAVLSLMAFIIVYSAIWLLSKVQNKIVYLLNIRLKSAYMEKASLQKVDTNQEISTLINDFKLIESNYFNLIVQIISDICMSLFSTIFVLRLNLLLGIVFIVFALPQLFIPNAFQGILSKRSTDWSLKNSLFIEKLRDLMRGLQS